MILRLRPPSVYLVQNIESGAPMPTKKRRIQLTLHGDLDVVLARLSELTERPQSALVLELLQDTLPVLKQTVEALELAKSGKLNLDGLIGMVQDSISHAQAIESEMLETKKAHKDKTP